MCIVKGGYQKLLFWLLNVLTIVIPVQHMIIRYYSQYHIKMLI